MEAQKSVNYVKSGIWYAIGNILIKGISFISLPIFTRLLNPDDFGKYNIFLSYENILHVIIGLGISGTIKIAYFDYNEDFAKYFTSVLSLTTFTALLFDILANIIIFLLGINNGTIWTVELINLLIFSSLATAIYNLISTKYVIEAAYKQNLSISLVYTVTNILVSIALCLTVFSSQRYLGRIIGQSLPLILLTVIIGSYYVSKYKTILNVQYWKYALKLGFPLILHMLSMVVLLQIGRLMIDYFLGSSYTGIYSVAATLAGVLSVLLSSYDNAWAPWFYRGLAGEKGINLLQGNNKLSIIFALGLAVFMLLSPEILDIMTTFDYYDAIFSIIPLTLSVYVNFMYLFAVNQEYFYKKTKVIAFGTVIATLTAIVLNYLLIPRLGYIAAAYVDLISKGILYLIHTLVVKRMNKDMVVSNSMLLSLLLGLFVIGLFSILWKDNVVARGIVVLLLFPIIYRYLISSLKLLAKNNE